jgi:hypothetical protein
LDQRPEDCEERQERDQGRGRQDDVDSAFHRQQVRRGDGKEESRELVRERRVGEHSLAARRGKREDARQILTRLPAPRLRAGMLLIRPAAVVDAVNLLARRRRSPREQARVCYLHGDMLHRSRSVPSLWTANRQR